MLAVKFKIIQLVDYTSMKHALTSVMDT